MQTITKYTDPTRHSAQEWKDKATECARRSAESWERSDTDGFLSQWASDSMAHFYRDLAEVAATGGRRDLPWLFDAKTGLPLDEGSWRWVQTRYGSSVAIGDRPNTLWFRPSQARKGAVREANDRAKGFVWGVVACDVVLYQYGTTVLMTGYAAKIGAELTVVSVGGYTDHT